MEPDRRRTVLDLNLEDVDHYLQKELEKPEDEQNKLLITELHRQRLRLIRPPDTVRIKE